MTVLVLVLLCRRRHPRDEDDDDGTRHSRVESGMRRRQRRLWPNGQAVPLSTTESRDGAIADARPRQLTCARRSRCRHRDRFRHRAKPALFCMVLCKPEGRPAGTRDPDRFRTGLRGVGTGPALETRG